VKDKPIEADKVQTYLEKKFGDDLPAVQGAMTALANGFEREDLEGRAYSLYETFRPDIPKGKRGWGAQGELDLDLIRSLATKT